MSYANDVMPLWIEKVKAANVVIFDLDGTLIETDTANCLAYKAAIAHWLGQDIAAKFPSNRRITRTILNEHLINTSKITIQNIVRYKESIYEQFLHTTKVNQKMYRLLKLAQGKKVILASDCHFRRGELLLAYHNIGDSFTEKYFSGGDNSDHKYKKIRNNWDLELYKFAVFDDDSMSISYACKAGFNPKSIFLVGKSC